MLILFPPQLAELMTRLRNFSIKELNILVKGIYFPFYMSYLYFYNKQIWEKRIST